MFRFDCLSCRFIVSSQEGVELVWQQWYSGSDEPHWDWFVVPHSRHAQRDQVRVRPETFINSSGADPCSAEGTMTGPKAWWIDPADWSVRGSPSPFQRFPTFCPNVDISTYLIWVIPILFFLLFSLVFIKTMSGELLCPNVDDKKQECHLRIFFFLSTRQKCSFSNFSTSPRM